MKRVQSGANNPERTSPFLGTFLGNSSSENGIFDTSMNAFKVQDIKKENVMSLKGIKFAGFADWFEGL